MTPTTRGAPLRLELQQGITPRKLALAEPEALMG
jgi:hypothetical protein